MIRFSIIIPNYNKEEYIKDCLDSIKNQTFDTSKYEVLFIDDGSTDKSVDIAKSYDVKIFYSDRALAGGARNIGLDNAKGEYILFLDSDDYLASNDVLEELDKYIKNEDLVFLDYIRQKEFKDEIIVETGNTISEKIKSTPSIACPTKCFKRELLNDIRFDANCYYEDVSFVLECLCKANTYTYFRKPYYVYRRVCESITKTKEISAKKMVDVFLQITKLYYLCDKYPKYKDSLLARIKNDKLDVRLEVLNEYFLTGKNTFDDKFTRNM